MGGIYEVTPFRWAVMHTRMIYLENLIKFALGIEAS
jgi:hypothetical protein